MLRTSPLFHFIIIAVFVSTYVHCNAQEEKADSLNQPLLPKDNIEFLKNIYVSLDMRMAFKSYVLRGGDHDYQGNQFENEFTALNIRAKVHDKVRLNFRNRYNKTTSVQSLDQLGNSIELANIEVQATPKLNVKIGRQEAFFGGYEYFFSAMDVLEYNDIQNNALAYVTGVGLNYKISDKNKLGFQVLNSRTMHYDDKYGDDENENIQEPDWPFEVVGRWEGNYFDGKFQTKYSYSYSREVKDKGTHFVTLGHQYQNDKLRIMYDFDYSHEQVDTKGVATDIIQEESVAQNVTYLENWLRSEYDFSSQFTGLLTLMTNSTYGKRFEGIKDKNRLLRRSYGVIPTLYYHPFNDLDLRFFIAFIHRYYDYSNFSKNELGATSYNSNELRFGFISPLRFL